MIKTVLVDGMWLCSYSSECFNVRKMLIFIACVSSLLSYVSSESCFYQRCLNCRPEEVVWPGTMKECEPSNWVSPEWVHNLGHPPPWTDSKVPIEYRCLKMVATPDSKTYGNTVDVIRGCVPRAQVDSVCLGLLAVERARSHSDARCSICWGNNCNSSTRVKLQVFLAFLVILYFVLR